MRAVVLVFPGSNCDRDMADGLRNAGADVTMLWHKERALPDHTDLVAVPGGFSFGDYLRCGAIAARAPICPALNEHIARGGFALGVCNGFQILTEMGALPGVLQRNAGLKYICRPQKLRVETVESVFTNQYAPNEEIQIPIAHHDGNYMAREDELNRLENEGRVAFRYLDNPNGSCRDIAGILSENRRVLGMMPHPDRSFDPEQGSTDGKRLFAALFDAVISV